MMNKLLISTAAAALLASAIPASAQGMRENVAPGAAPVQQNAPAEKIAPPAPGGSTGQGTTGQGIREEQKATPSQERGAQSPAERASPGATQREGSDMKSQGAPAKDKSRATTGQGASGAASANLTTEQRTKITSTIKQQSVKPVTNVNFSIEVGTAIPRNIERHRLPATVIDVYPAWRGYEYILIQDEIVVIDPATLRIVAVLEI